MASSKHLTPFRQANECKTNRGEAKERNWFYYFILQHHRGCHYFLDSLNIDCVTNIAQACLKQWILLNVRIWTLCLNHCHNFWLQQRSSVAESKSVPSLKLTCIDVPIPHRNHALSLNSCHWLPPCGEKECCMGFPISIMVLVIQTLSVILWYSLLKACFHQGCRTF